MLCARFHEPCGHLRLPRHCKVLAGCSIPPPPGMDALGRVQAAPRSPIDSYVEPGQQKRGDQAALFWQTEEGAGAERSSAWRVEHVCMSSACGPSHDSPEKIMAAERPCPAGPKTPASRKTVAKTPHSRRSVRTRLSDLAGLGGGQLFGSQGLDLERHPAGKVPGMLLSPSRHAALMLSSLQPPSPVASAVDPLAANHLLHSDTFGSSKELLAAHESDGAGSEMSRGEVSERHRSQHNWAAGRIASTMGLQDGSLGDLSCSHSGLPEPRDSRRFQNTPRTKAPGGPQTPSLTPTTSCSISESSSLDGGMKCSQNAVEFAPQLRCEIPDQKSGDQTGHTIPCILQPQPFSCKGHLPAEKEDTKLAEREPCEDGSTLTPVSTLSAIETLDASNSAALLMQETEALMSTFQKRNALDCWNLLMAKRRSRELTVAEYRERILSSRCRTLFAFDAWRCLGDLQSTDCDLTPDPQCRQLEERKLSQPWFAYAHRQAARAAEHTQAMYVQGYASRRSTKKLTFEVWNRHTSVVIWTHGRLRLAAYNSRVITLRGIFKRIRRFIADRQASCSTAAWADRRAERCLLQRVWMALVAHIIDMQLQAAVSSPSQNSAFLPTASNRSTEGSPVCRRTLFGESEGAGTSTYREEVNGDWNEKVIGDGLGDTSAMEALLRRQLSLTRTQAVLITKLRERLDSQSAQLGQARAQSQSDAQVLKGLQTKMLEDSVMIRLQKRRERSLISQLAKLQELQELPGNPGFRAPGAPQGSKLAGNLSVAAAAPRDPGRNLEASASGRTERQRASGTAAAW